MNAEQTQIETPAPAATAAPAPPPPKTTSSRLWRKVAIAIVAGLVLGKGVPWLLHALRTESTDDAYVNSYVKFVAPRV